MISKSKQESKRGPNQTSQITETPQRGKASLKSVMVHRTEKVIIGDRKEE